MREGREREGRGGGVGVGKRGVNHRGSDLTFFFLSGQLLGRPSVDEAGRA